MEIIKRALAYTPTIGTNPTVPGSGITDIFGLSSAVIDWILGVAGTLVLIALIVGGLQYMFAGPDAEKAAAGRKTITYAITGLIIVITSFAIVTLIHTRIH